MEARLRIDALLRELLKNSCGQVNLYYQPPAGYQLRYPCIVYTPVSYTHLTLPTKA